MCEFISFFHRPDNGDIAVYDLTSHSDTQEKLNLNNLWREGHYKKDGQVECRVEDGDRQTQEECNERLKNKYATFYDFLEYCLMAVGEEYHGYLDLSGCDLGKIKKWPASIDGSIDLSGCDLGKIKKWPASIGGYLYLRGCDLSKTKIPRYLKDRVVT